MKAEQKLSVLQNTCRQNDEGDYVEEFLIDLFTHKSKPFRNPKITPMFAPAQGPLIARSISLGHSHDKQIDSFFDTLTFITQFKRQVIFPYLFVSDQPSIIPYTTPRLKFRFDAYDFSREFNWIEEKGLRDQDWEIEIINTDFVFLYETEKLCIEHMLRTETQARLKT